MRKPHVLIILDGFGHREASDSNAIQAARTPHWNQILAENPHGLISGSGEDVGLPDGQMGNSEVGHMNLGAGRIVYQDFTRITKAIRDGDFYTNPVITAAVDKAVAAGKAVHVLGLLSEGGVHSHEDHLHAMVKLAVDRGAQQVYVHAFLDGRDTPPKSAMPSLQRMEDAVRATGKGRVASLIGRYFAMDRDNRWDRVEQAYRLLTEGLAVRTAATAMAGLDAAYAAGENDEFVKATVIAAEGEQPVVLADGDAVVFMNFRADRAREITRAFVDEEFTGFTRSLRPQLAAWVMLTQYASSIKAPVAYAPASLHNTLGEYLASLGKTQLRIAETEKYAHVTFFFSGGREDLYPGEQRILVPSPQVATYDLQPEMSAFEVTDKLVAAIQSGDFDVLVCNYANGDMVGHTGVFEAAVKAVEALDVCLGRLYEAVKASGGEMLITADHGNVEQMVDYENDQPHTAHTCEFVPFVYVGGRKAVIRSGGVLSDVAPTLLNLMGVPVPPEMTGKNLVQAV
ncbi:MAG: 2,3-bisphosphoglycerate-independent phosphoglycerate mutase [Fluviicoccus sp.]|uniref:2,3-bisphosphoglycerate-independent phosphoglycerate mutase n=1 Tax=Fluviicoccus sp. TaxID=2003552 RepID=UPI002717CC41|nr:2,3-bisphosphoglycerate-independent phosphoglycerate mutase [Fluviicoccus sp.]MDO8331090.1 2,3-bisphosphoglycerate-independent phosphoglycerate mutase [Fluviicoccus sp.]